MLSIHDLGSLGSGGANARGAVAYYEQTTRADRQGVGLKPAPEGASEGVVYGVGAHAPADLREGRRLTRDDVEALLRGEWRGQAVQNAHDERRFMGWDCTFSAPKCVSIAYAVADPETRSRIDEAVREAALRALNDVALPELYARTGRGGVGRVAVSVPITLYQQHLSRASDPQLHVHVILPSFGWGPDGRVHTVEAHELYRAKTAVGQSFRLQLAHELERRVGLRLQRGEDGELRIAGVSAALEEHFSKRSEQVEKELQKRLGPDAWTEASAAQKMAATVASRPPHDRGYREDWREQAAAAGLEADWRRAAEAVARGREQQRAELSPEERAARLDQAVDAARNTITFGGTSAVHGREIAGEAVVEQRQLLAEAAARAVGTGASLDEVRAAVDRAVERGLVVSLELGETPLGARITTPEMIRLERQLLEDWRALVDHRGHGVAPDHVQQAVREWEAAHPGQRLSSDQVAAVHAMTSGRGAAAVEGLAGTGKTEALSAARRAYELAGYRVIGESYSGAAASEMQRASQISSSTIALAEVRGRDLNDRSVVILDEAARATSPQLARLVAEAVQTNAKVVLVGDPHQLQPIGPGGSFRHLTRELVEHAPEASATIQQIRRQEHAPPEVREVAELAARGRAGEALRRADAAGLVHVHGTADDMRQAAARELADALRDGKTALGLTATRRDASALNEAVRRELRDRGALHMGEHTYTVTKMRQTLYLQLSEGDRVACKLNSYDLGVRNGWRGEVVGISRTTGAVTVRLDGHVRLDRAGRVMWDAVIEARQDGTWRAHDRDAERYVVVPADRVARVLDHDYARTADRAQGVTVDHAVVAGHAESSRFDRQWGAVAFTRQRETISVHLSTEGMERPEQRQATWEAAHWPRPGRDGQEPRQDAIREARERLNEAQQAWRRARDGLRRAREDLQAARASGDAERLAAARERVGAAREAERAAHADYRSAREACRDARSAAREAWREAKAAAHGQAGEHGRELTEHAIQEQQPVSQEAKAEAVERAAERLRRGRPGASTLDYQRTTREREMAQAAGLERAR